MPFDPNKPHGVVSPPTNGCFLYQAGKHYDVHHNEVDFDTGKIVAKAPKPAPAPEVKGPDKLPDPRPNGMSMSVIGKTVKVDSLDLTKWAQGDFKAPFFKIKAEVTKQFGKTPNNSEEAKAIVLGA